MGGRAGSTAAVHRDAPRGERGRVPFMTPEPAAPAAATGPRPTGRGAEPRIGPG